MNWSIMKIKYMIMKKIIICSILFASMAVCSESGAVAMPRHLTSQSVLLSSEWEYLGNVTAYYSYGYGNNWNSISLGLYVRVIDGYAFYKIKDTYEDYKVNKNHEYNPNANSGQYQYSCKYVAGRYYIKDISI